jgi:hypothetical protein
VANGLNNARLLNNILLNNKKACFKPVMHLLKINSQKINNHMKIKVLILIFSVTTGKIKCSEEDVTGTSRANSP